MAYSIGTYHFRQLSDPKRTVSAEHKFLKSTHSCRSLPLPRRSFWQSAHDKILNFAMAAGPACHEGASENCLAPALVDQPEHPCGQLGAKSLTREPFGHFRMREHDLAVLQSVIGR